MKYLLYLLFVAFVSFMGCKSKHEPVAHDHNSGQAEVAQIDTVKKSIPKEEHAMLNDTHFTIKYHAPAVRGRTIWGGLVPYNEVWVTGAHSATSLEIDREVTVAGTKIAAGKYAIFTIPGREKWTIIINRKWDQHLADEYDSKDDVVRIDVVPAILPANQERLNYSITLDTESRASINISWEKLKVTLPVELN